MALGTALTEKLVKLDTQSSDGCMTRAQRDALRIHAQQLLSCLTSLKESEQSIEVINYLLNDLENAATAMADDYAANNERAFQQKEYDKWKKITEVCQQQREKLSTQQKEFESLGHHAMGRGIATCLLGDMSNLSYVLAMNVSGILKTCSSLTTAFGSAASTISSVAGTMNSVQPYLGIGVYSALVVFDTVCIAKHKYEREIDGYEKKKEKSYTKLLEHGRWINWVNAAVWIMAGIASTLSLATPVIIVSAMACAILITSVIRIAHQIVEINKLKDVAKSYAKQLEDPNITPEKRVALQMLQEKVSKKIKLQTNKLTSTVALSTVSMVGIGLVIAAVVMSFTPLMIVGAALLLIAGLTTIITNRHAIGAAFKTIFKPKNDANTKQNPSATPSSSNPESDKLSVTAKPDPDAGKLNREIESVEDGDKDEKSVAERAKEAGITYANSVPENTRTKRALSSMARTHRPPTGNNKDVIKGIEERTKEKQQEALREIEDDENDVA